MSFCNSQVNTLMHSKTSSHLKWLRSDCLCCFALFWIRSSALSWSESSQTSRSSRSRHWCRILLCTFCNMSWMLLKVSVYEGWSEAEPLYSPSLPRLLSNSISTFTLSCMAHSAKSTSDSISTLSPLISECLVKTRRSFDDKSIHKLRLSPTGL